MKHSPSTKPIDRTHVMLTEDFYFSTRYGLKMAPKGFIFDGASGPMSAAFLLHLGNYSPPMLGPTCGHDLLFRSKELTFKEANTVYFDMMIDNEIKLYKAKTHYVGVSKLGKKAWRNQPIEFKLDPR